MSRLIRPWLFVILKISGCFKYHQAYRQTILRSAHTLYLCVLCGSQNKQRLYPYTALTSFYIRDGVFTARYGLHP
jgi:hypothetical protein